jgi:hypothetical protein
VTPVVTSVLDSHVLKADIATPKSKSSEPVNSRTRKRDAHGENVGSSEESVPQPVALHLSLDLYFCPPPPNSELLKDGDGTFHYLNK